MTGTLKIADFGLAIGPAGISHQLINYVVTRWYRFTSYISRFVSRSLHL